MSKSLIAILPVGRFIWAMGDNDVNGYNAPHRVDEVFVYIDPDLDIAGCTNWLNVGTGQMQRPEIVLSKWNLAVLVHELAHVAFKSQPVVQAADNDGHSFVIPIEVTFAPLITTLARLQAIHSVTESRLDSALKEE